MATLCDINCYAAQCLTSFSLQDNDIERETTLNRDHLDYVVEESWRWVLSCEFAIHTIADFAYF